VVCLVLPDHFVSLRIIFYFFYLIMRTGRPRYYSDDSDLPFFASVGLSALPALFGMGALHAGLNTARSLIYSPPKRVNSYPFSGTPKSAVALPSYTPYASGVGRIRQRDFGMGSRKFSMASLRRYKVYLRRRKFYKAAHKLFF